MAEASAGADQASPEDWAGWSLVQAYHRVGRRFHETFAAAGLTAHQFGVLVQLDREPGVSQAALARHVLVTPQSMGDLLGQLEALGYLRRTRAAFRGAAASVELTDTGRRILAEVFPRVAAINTPAALGLTPGECESLNGLLRRVLDHLSR